MSLLIKETASNLAGCTPVNRKQIQRSSDRIRLTWIERGLKPAFETAECVPRLRVFLANHIKGQLVIFDELHARSLSRRCQEAPE